VKDSTRLDLESLFDTTLEAVQAHRQEINDLDEYNHNHGNNMVENMRIIADAVSNQGGKPPSETLRRASQALEARGMGGTSQYYATGLNQAAERLQGHSQMSRGDVMALVQSLLGAVPSQGHPQQMETGSSVLEHVMGLAGSQGQAAQDGGDLLAQTLSTLGNAQQPAVESQAQGPGGNDLLETLLPAGLAFLQAQQSGATTGQAAGQALMSVLSGGQGNSLQAQTPRDAAGGFIIQSILGALLNRR
jgi:hypothetical protein